jgi:hypothetical protein
MADFHLKEDLEYTPILGSGTPALAPLTFLDGSEVTEHQLILQVGEGFIRELEYSRVWLRLNGNSPDENEDIIAEFKCDTKDLLEQCYVSFKPPPNRKAR